MGLVVRLLWLLALGVLPIAGCVQVTAEGDGGVGVAPLFLAVSGSPTEDEPRRALESVRVCQSDTTNCATTGATGELTLELPVGLEVSITLEKDGYASYLAPIVMPVNGVEDRWIMASNQYLAEQYDLLTSPYPRRLTGGILLELIPAFEGATFQLVSATGKAYYHDEEGNRSLDLAETTSYGWGGFVEVSPGDFQVNVGGTVQRCTPGIWGWPGTVESSIRFAVREGYETVAILRCPAP